MKSAPNRVDNAHVGKAGAPFLARFLREKWGFSLTQLHRLPLLAAAGGVVAACAIPVTLSFAGPKVSPVPDTAASQTAFLQVYKVLTSPRCANCHPSGDAPLQGDDSHVHIQNVKRGLDGHGTVAMRCNTCHQDHNLPGTNMPPGNPKWSLPPPEHKMVFVGRTPAELCRQIKDPQQNGGRSLAQLYDHVAHDDLVGWAWNPGEGRTLPPLTREETAQAMTTWIDGGAACPE
jgi:hypothetical protein